MMEPNEFVSQWTYSNLFQYDMMDVQSLSIPEISKRFLTEAGLPLRQGIMVPTNTLPTLLAYYGGNYAFPPEVQHYRLLCVAITMLDDLAAFYCLDDHNDGRVMMVYWKWGDKLVADILNSSFPQYAESLLILRRYSDWLGKVVRAGQKQGPNKIARDPLALNAKVERMGQSVLRHLRHVDPLAFQIGTAWEEQMYRLEGGMT